MGRPVNANAELTRTRIIDSAARLFSARGAGQTSVRDIARGAGVSLAMVHHYFGSKDDLYRSCVDSMYAELAELRAALGAAAVELEPSAPLIDRVVRACFRFARDHRPALRLVMRSVVDTGEIDAERREDVLIPFLAQATAILGGAAAASDPALRQSVRLSTQSIVFLVVRYALAATDELALIAGLDRASPVADADPEVLAAIEHHLVGVARQLFGRHDGARAQEK